MAGPGSLAGIAANAGSEALAFGLGFALSRVLEPYGTELAYTQWEGSPVKVPDAGAMAEGVARGKVNPFQAAGWAKKHGYDAEAFDALVTVSRTGPELGRAYAAWRRGFLDDDGFDTALERTGLEEAFKTAYRRLHDELLDPGAIATAIHRGIIAGSGLLIREPPTTAGRVPFVAASGLDGVAEFAGHGITAERGRVLVGNAGLPLSLGEMLRLLNMGEATEDDVRRSVAQGNVRNEYMDVALALRRRLLTPHEYAELRVRGWIDDAQMLAGAGLHGMTDADARLLFELLGRPIPLHQVVTGLARGGVYDGPTDQIPPPALRSLQEGNLRPEWYHLAWANRYTYPAAFVLRTLTQSGDLTEEETRSILLYEAWEPALAAKVAKRWAGGTGAKADPHITKAEGQLWNALHRAYVNDEATDAVTRSTLEAAGVTAEAIAEVVRLWDRERTLVRLTLTPQQIKKAVGQPGKTEAWALERLHELGMPAEDARTFLAE